MCPGIRGARSGTARCCWRRSVAPLYFTWSAFAVFVVLLELTMCTGHSVGFHRRLIHRTFKCPKWIESVLVWSGTLVGMQGPFWVIQSHDLRDWAQRQPNCHPFLKHGQGLLKDAWWSLHCRLRLAASGDSIPARGSATIVSIDSCNARGCCSRSRSRRDLVRGRRHAVADLGRVRAGHDRCVDALVRRLHLPHARSAELARQYTARYRRTTCRGPRFRRWAKAGTTTTTRSRLPRVTGCIPGQIDIGFRFVQLLERLGLGMGHSNAGDAADEGRTDRGRAGCAGGAWPEIDEPVTKSTSP